MAAADTDDIPILEGARARARAEVHVAIVASASAQLAAGGASSLSLRAVARDLGMASSAVYRYFDSRDTLLTALIVEAYESLGEHAEHDVAITIEQPPALRWVSAARAIREWALTHPHDYALLYGTPVPGYAAPDVTVVPGTRVTRALITIVRDAAESGDLTAVASSTAAVSSTTSASFGVIRPQLGLDERVGDATIMTLVTAWTQLFGLVSFELFGQTRNFVADDEALFVDAARTMARLLGLEG